MLLAYHVASTLVVGLLGCVLLVSLKAFRRPRGPLPEPAPFVSVLVPARNEERSIEGCVRSLLAQNYPAGCFEVIVLDDESDDRTGAIVTAIARDAPHLRLARGSRPPRGWVGKPWACQTLARMADTRARWLLFTDADTVHAPAALRTAVAEAEHAGVELLSLFPRQRTGSWIEHAVIPLVLHQMIGYLPLPAAERLAAPALAAANGQFMLFRTDFYQSMGGHAVVAHVLAEDVALARAVKARRGSVRLGNGSELVTCRMYYGPREVVSGLARSFSAGFRLSLPISLLLVACNLLFFLAPLAWLVLGLLARAAWWPWAGLQVAFVSGMRLVLAARTRTALSEVLWHPVGMVVLLGIQARAWVDAFVRRRGEWKGRSYLLFEK